MNTSLFLIRCHLSPNRPTIFTYSSALLYPSIPRFQNSLHHRHFHCSLQASLLQLSLSQPAQIPDHPTPGSNKPRTLSCTCCCQSSQTQSHHSYPIRSLHWLYKLLSFRPTYKVLTTTQPSYLHNLITVQPSRSTRSSSLLTLARPFISSSLRITDRSFQYASPRL